jgi:hypothetical protein
MIALIPEQHMVVTLQSNADMKNIANNLVFDEILAAIGTAGLTTIVEENIEIANT